MTSFSRISNPLAIADSHREKLKSPMIHPPSEKSLGVIDSCLHEGIIYLELKQTSPILSEPTMSLQ